MRSKRTILRERIAVFLMVFFGGLVPILCVALVVSGILGRYGNDMDWFFLSFVLFFVSPFLGLTGVLLNINTSKK